MVESHFQRFSVMTKWGNFASGLDQTLGGPISDQLRCPEGGT